MKWRNYTRNSGSRATDKQQDKLLQEARYVPKLILSLSTYLTMYSLFAGVDTPVDDPMGEDFTETDFAANERTD